MEFFALGRGQAVAAQSFIESSLLEPLADRLNCRFEFTCQRGNAAPAARQFNDSTPVFRCVWWMGSGHLENSFPYPQHPLRNWVNFKRPLDLSRKSPCAWA